MIEDKGQLSIEFLMIFSLILMILIIFTIPLTEIIIKDNLDIKKAIDLKNDLNKIANGVDVVFINGKGSKETITIVSDFNYDVKMLNNNIKANLILNNNSNKKIIVKTKYNNLNSFFTVEKGVNKVIIEWPSNSSNIKLNKI